MVVNIHKLIAAICPAVYCEQALVPKIKKMAEQFGYLAAAELAEPIAPDMLDFREPNDPFDLAGIHHPIEKNSFVYQATSPYVSPLYYWCLDRLRAEHYAVEKLVDSLETSPGGGQAGDWASKATRMQERMDKTLKTGSEAIGSFLDLLTKAKQLKKQLAQHEDLKSDDPRKRKEALWHLKNYWLTNMDEKKGDLSLLRLCQQSSLDHLRAIFMADDPYIALQEMNLDGNRLVVLKDKLHEFEEWMKVSERDAGVAFDIMKVNLLNLSEKVCIYGRWVKPHLGSTRIRPGERIGSADVVSIFNTAVVDILLLGHRQYDVEQAVISQRLPKWFEQVSARTYSSIVFLEIRSRLTPNQRGEGLSGKTEVAVTSYALNNREIEVLLEEMAKDNLRCALSALGGISASRIQRIENDIHEVFANPVEAPDKWGWLAVLLPFLRRNRPAAHATDIPGDSGYEKVLRSEAALSARKLCRKFGLDMKHQLGMVSYRFP
jgi:hypothetical protein